MTKKMMDEIEKKKREMEDKKLKLL